MNAGNIMCEPQSDRQAWEILFVRSQKPPPPLIGVGIAACEIPCEYRRPSSGLTENEMKRTLRSSGFFSISATHWLRIGQGPPHSVKMKSAIQTCPIKSVLRTVRSSWSRKANAGTWSEASPAGAAEVKALEESRPRPGAANHSIARPGNNN